MPSSSDPEEALLQSACDLLRHEWVKSFLFPTDRRTFARQLHHALSQQTAITASVHFGTQSPSVGPCQALAGVEKKLSVLCVPSFSTGSITVGFEITECLADSSPRPLGIPKYIGRYVRDDDEGLMLIIAEHPHLGVTEVTCCTLLSAGCRSQLYAVMNLRKLRGIASKVHQDGYDRTAIRRATIFAYSSVDMRACPNCGCNTVLLCSCRLTTKRKAHPMDHDAEFQNLSTFTGDFGGLAKVKVIKDGKESVASFISKVQAIFTGSRESRRNLSSWAMTHAFETETLRVWNYRMPDERLIEDVSDTTTTGEDSCTSRTLGRASGQGEKRKRDVAKDIPVRRRFRKTSEGSVISSASIAGKSSVLDDALLAASKAVAEERSTCTPAQESLTSVTGGQLHVTLASTGTDRSRSAEKTGSCVKPPLPNVHRGSPCQQKRSEQEVTATNAQITKPVQSVTITQPHVAISTQGEQVIPVIQPMQHLPGVVLVPVRPVYQPILSHGVPLAPALTPMPTTKLHRDNRSKDEIRKARNRASAQRSNEKKKREVAKLKDDLEAFVKRKEILVERERVLRHENAALKAALGDTGVPV